MLTAVPPVDATAAIEPVVDSPSGEPTALPIDPATEWLYGARWLPDATFDAGAHALPDGLREETPSFVWHYRPANRPEVVDTKILQDVLASQHPGSDNALTLYARSHPQSLFIPRLREIARDGMSQHAATAIEASLLMRRSSSARSTLAKSQSATIESERTREEQQREPHDDARREEERQRELRELEARKKFGEPQRRAAAIEAWSLTLAASEAPEHAWAELLDGVDEQSPIEVRAETYRSLGRGIAPTRVPAIAEWLATDELGLWPRELRRSVLDGCLLFAAHHPQDLASVDVDLLMRLQYDSDALCRRRFGRLVAIYKTQSAFEILKSQTHDIDHRVRHAAFVNLGVLGGSDAAALLEKSKHNDNEQVRAAVVLALSMMTSEAAIGFGDESAVVRQAAARSTVNHPSPATQNRLLKLITDPDRQVQLAAVEAVETWDDALALPVITEALVESSSIAREAALAAIRDRTVIAEPFSTAASRDDRAARVAEWRTAYNLPEREVVFPNQAAPSDPEGLRIAIAQLDTDPNSKAAWQTLRAMTVDDIRELERLLEPRRLSNQPIDWPVLWDEILPPLRKDFAALKQLKSADVTERMRGAHALAAFAETHSLSSLVESSLVPLMTQEQNGNVWRDVMRAVSQNIGPVVDELIPLALNSQWPDVHVIACEIIEAHPKPDYAVWLRPVLNDNDSSVRVAAIKAAGACGHPSLLDGPGGGLRALLAAPSKDTRMAAATAMARLGDTQGMQQLLRLAYSPDVNTRRNVAQSLALVGTPEFGDPIWTRALTERDQMTQNRYLEVLKRINPTAATWPDDADYARKLEIWQSSSWGKNLTQ